MKILLALFFGISLLGFGNGDPIQDENAMVNYSPFQEMVVPQEYCKLTISGYGNLVGIRVQLTLSAEAETCEEAAAELRAKIIEQEIRIAY